MSRLTIPQDVDDLIAEVSPIISPNTTPIDVIRIALFKMKEQHLLLSTQTPIGINNPLHPFYNRLTPEEEKVVLEARNEKIEFKGNSQELINWLNK